MAAARIALTALPVAAVVGVAVPFITTWWAAGISLIAWGVFYQLVVINSVTYRQQVTPEHMLGRVNTAGRMLAWGMGWTGGAFLAGVLVGWLGLVPTLVVLSSTGILATAVAWTSPLRAQLTSPPDRSPRTEDPAARAPTRPS